MTRVRIVLFLSCFFLSCSLVFASVAISNERWALEQPADGSCTFNLRNAQCLRPERTLQQARRIPGRENARGIGGFYVDPDDNPPNGIILYSVYRTRNGEQGERSKPLAQAGRNYLDFPPDTISFRYQLVDYRGGTVEQTPGISPDTEITISFEMNYDLDY